MFVFYCMARARVVVEGSLAVVPESMATSDARDRLKPKRALRIPEYGQ